MHHFNYSLSILAFTTISIMLLALLLSSCTSKQGRILQQADSVMESRPDSAMTLLEGIYYSKLNKSDLPYYALLYTQAQIKTNIPLDSDSLIRLAYARYGNDFKGDRGLRSNFYIGEVLFNQQKNPEAMRYFLIVYEESKRNGNDYWRAKAAEKISELFFYAYNYDEAEKYAQEAAGLFRFVDRQTFHRYALAKLAIYLINNGKNQRAYYLLDSLHKVTVADNPCDTLYLNYIRLPLVDAAVQSGNIKYLKTLKINPVMNKDNGVSLDEGIVQDHLYGDSSNFEKARNTLEKIDTIGFSNDDRLHYLYALYKNAEALGDKSLALSYVDSLILLQSKITERVIKESVTGAQRDFYSNRVLQKDERNAYLRYQIITLSVVFILILGLMTVIICQKHKEYKNKEASDLETIMTLRSSAKNLTLEKNELHESLEEKGARICELNDSIEEIRHNIEVLTQEIKIKDNEYEDLRELLEKKNVESARLPELQELLNKKDTESMRLQHLLNQKELEYKNIHTLLAEKIEKETSQAEIIEKLFREKWTTLDRLCAEFFSINQSEISSKGLLESISKEMNRVTSDEGIEEIVTAVDLYMGGIITLLRSQCPFIKEKDIHYIALVYAGFTVKAVCLFMDIQYQYFFVKKSRLIKRIEKSNAPDKDLFISKFS